MDAADYVRRGTMARKVLLVWSVILLLIPPYYIGSALGLIFCILIYGAMFCALIRDREPPENRKLAMGDAS